MVTVAMAKAGLLETSQSMVKVKLSGPLFADSVEVARTVARTVSVGSTVPVAVALAGAVAWIGVKVGSTVVVVSGSVVGLVSVVGDSAVAESGMTCVGGFVSAEVAGGGGLGVSPPSGALQARPTTTNKPTSQAICFIDTFRINIQPIPLVFTIYFKGNQSLIIL